MAGWAAQVRHKAPGPVVSKAFTGSAEPSAVQAAAEEAGACGARGSAAALLHCTRSCLGAYQTGASSPCVTRAHLHHTGIEWHFPVCEALALNFLVYKS